MRTLGECMRSTREWEQWRGESCCFSTSASNQSLEITAMVYGLWSWLLFRLWGRDLGGGSRTKGESQGPGGVEVRGERLGGIGPFALSNHDLIQWALSTELNMVWNTQAICRPYRNSHIFLDVLLYCQSDGFNVVLVYQCCIFKTVNPENLIHHVNYYSLFIMLKRYLHAWDQLTSKACPSPCSHFFHINSNPGGWQPLFATSSSDTHSTRIQLW